MRLRTRLILVIGLATLLPLALAGVTSSRLARQGAVDQARDLHARQAAGLAVLTGTWLGDLERSVALAVDIWDVEQLSEAELEALQRVLYKQFDAVNIVWTLTAGGESAAPATLLDADTLARAPALADHQPVSPGRLSAFEEGIPLEQALVDGIALGDIRVVDGGPVVALAVASDSGELVVAVEVSLAELERHFASQAVAGGATVLLDADGQAVFGGALPLDGSALAELFAGTLAGELVVQQDEPVLAAFHGVERTPWTVVVAVPEQVITAGGERIRQKTLYVYFLAVALVAVVGAVAARQVSQPVVELKRAAEALGRGEFGRQVDSAGRDEVAELARSFNEMSLALRDKTQVIEAKNAEIEAFNQELQERVEERTRALRESQARLVQSSRMAAVAQLGAGLAHELNNPVAGILGLAQVARVQSGEGPLDPLLGQIEAQAVRCKEVLQALHRFSGASGSSDRVEVDLQRVLQEVLVLTRGATQEARLEVALECDGPLPVQGDPALLGQAFAQLLKSLRAGLAPGGRVLLVGERRDGQVRVLCEQQGERRGSDDDWLASGMGFWVATQVVHEHGGELSQRDDGHYAVTLPSG